MNVDRCPPPPPGIDEASLAYDRFDHPVNITKSTHRRAETLVLEIPVPVPSTDFAEYGNGKGSLLGESATVTRYASC